MNRSLLSVISGGYGLLKTGHKVVEDSSHKKYIEWKVDDTIQVSCCRGRDSNCCPDVCV